MAVRACITDDTRAVRAATRSCRLANRHAPGVVLTRRQRAAPAVMFGAGRSPEAATKVRIESFDGPLALLLTLIEARQLDVRNLLLEVNEWNLPARRLYERAGFADRKYRLMGKWLEQPL